MTALEFLGLIYHYEPNTPICGHCLRPLTIRHENGETYCICEHCLWTQEQDAKDDFWRKV